MSAPQVFQAGNLPQGAFLTTLGGRRCTAVPRPAPTTSAEPPAVASVAAASAAPPAAATTSIGAIVAAGDVDANTVPAEASPLGLLPAATSTTSSPPDTFTANTISSPELEAAEVPRVQAAAEPPAPSPTALAATASAAAISSAPSPALPTLSVITSAQQQRQPAASRETSPTDSSVTAPAASDIAANDQPAAFPDQAAPSPSPSPDPAFPDVLAAPTGGGVAPEATNTSPTSNSAVSMLPSSSGSSVQSTVAVAGGVIGGVVALSIAAFLIWWWRRRVIKKRRSTLLTPLDAATYRDDKGGPYEINRGSIGPTPMGEKLRAAVGYNVKKIRGRLLSRSGPSVNMDRGTSQFIEVNNHSRATSSATIDNDPGVTARERLADWWSRLRYNRNRENRLSQDTLSIGGGNLNSSSIRSEKLPPPSSRQPDFLTLLNMDSGDDRDAARRRASLSRPPTGSSAQQNQFLGKLNLSFDSDNPFSDAHASAKPAPLVVSATNNPFSDANAIRDAAGSTKPSTYVADIRRSRGQSVSQQQQQQGYAPQQQQPTRGSVDSSFADRRNKFRSDPFDLEPRRSFVSSTAGTAGSSDGGGGGGVRRPAGAHRRGDSFTSKYSSGISMGDWSDPGPDVGPAASREVLPLPEEVEKQKGRGSKGSVGKAM